METTEMTAYQILHVGLLLLRGLILGIVKKDRKAKEKEG
jgi:hypothetical protein